MDTWKIPLGSWFIGLGIIHAIIPSIIPGYLVGGGVMMVYLGWKENKD